MTIFKLTSNESVLNYYKANDRSGSYFCNTLEKAINADYSYSRVDESEFKQRFKGRYLIVYEGPELTYDELLTVRPELFI